MNEQRLVYVEDNGQKVGPFTGNDLEELFLIKKEFSAKAKVLDNDSEVSIQDFFSLSGDEMKMYKLVDESHHGEMVLGGDNSITLLQVGYLITVLLFIISAFSLQIHPLLFFVLGSGSVTSLIVLTMGLLQYANNEHERNMLEYQQELVKMEYDDLHQHRE